jgi:hypothetical protein
LKYPKIIIFTVLISALILIFVYNSNSNSVSQVDLNIEKNIKTDDEVDFISTQNEENIQTNILNKLENKVQDTPLPKDAFKCFTLTDIQKQINNDVFEKFASENTLHPSSVPQYLTKLDENELIAEFEAGNASAAYVLGMNIFFSSYNTTFHHPSLTMGMLVDSNKSTKLNVDRLNEARKWLWVSAINGVGAGLGEIAATYGMEHDFLDADYQTNQGDLADIEKNLKALKVKQLSYNLLYVEVAPQVYDLFGVGMEHYKSQLEKIEIENKERIYKGIETQWVDDRFDFGQSKEIELKVPDEIKIAAHKNLNQC